MSKTRSERLTTEMGKLFDPLSANPTKWSNTLLPMNCLSVFDHFVKLAPKGLIISSIKLLPILLIISLLICQIL